MTVEEMKAELEANDYKDIADYEHLEAWGKPHPIYGFYTIFPNIYVAHEHLQKERQFEAMKALIERLAVYDVQDTFNATMTDYEAIADRHVNNLDDFVDEAKTIAVGLKP